jgi:hypothetical protein
MALQKSELYSSLWSSCDELRGGILREHISRVAIVHMIALGGTAAATAAKIADVAPLALIN